MANQTERRIDVAEAAPATKKVLTDPDAPPAELRSAGIMEADREAKANPDPITGAHGAHPLGTGIGAASAGAAGAAIGSALGPAGSVVGGAIGAVVGAVAGGLAGKAVAEGINPSEEDDYWSEAYASRPYVGPGSVYDDFRPAYRYGWEARPLHADKTFDEVEDHLKTGWERVKGESKLEWDKARDATRDAWDRVTPGTAVQRENEQSEKYRGETGNG